MNYIFKKNCTFREWYEQYKSDIIKLFHNILDWCDDEELIIYGTRKEFYRSFVYFVYKNSIPFIS